MKSHTKIFLFTILGIWQSRKTYNSVNPLYLMFNKINGYFEEINRNNYLTLIPTKIKEESMKNCGLKSEI